MRKKGTSRPRIFNSSIARTLLGSFMAFAVSAILINVLTGSLSIRVAKERTESAYWNSIHLLAGQMEDFLYDIQTQSGSFLLDNDLLEIAVSSREGLDLYEYAQFYDRINLYAKLRFADVDTILVLPGQGRVMSSKFGMGMMDEYDLLEEGGEGLPLRQAIWGIYPGIRDAGETRFSLVLGRSSKEQTAPYVVLELNREEILNKMKDYFADDNVKSLVLIDYQGEAYYTDFNSLMIEKIVETARNRQREQEASGRRQKAIEFPFREGQEEYTGVFAQIEGTGAMIGVVFDTREIIGPIRNVTAGLIAGLFAVAAVGVFFISMAYRKVLAPVITLTDALETVQKGRFDIRVSLPEDNDLSLIANEFNRMVERIDRMIKEDYQMRIDLQDAQLRFLKSQINPHFLYNSLFSLYNMIESDELENAADMAVYLGKYYQQSAHLDVSELAVEEEIENIRIYLKVHEMRFPGALVFRTEVEEELRRFRIPVLSLQTLVENAMTHGFRTTPKKGTLGIYVRREGEWVVMRVEDDGEGMSEERRRMIKERLGESENSLESHGIENVYQRLRLMYPEVALDVLPVLSGGTCVLIRIREGGR